MDRSPVSLDRPGVEVGVEEDDGVGEDEDGVGRAEAGHEHLVARDVPPGEHLNHLLHLLSLAWKDGRNSENLLKMCRDFALPGKVTSA